MRLKSVFEWQANMFSAFLVALVTSVLTILISTVIDRKFVLGKPALGNVVFGLSQNATSKPGLRSLSGEVMQCGDQLYSPIQKTCVDRSVFNAEMIRLYSALGLNTAPFQQKPSEQPNKNHNN